VQCLGLVWLLTLLVVVENERLPTELGWSKKEEPVTLQEILLAVEHIRNATNLITGSNSTGAKESAHATRELHFGGGDL
jgi:hypothetical protein